MMGNAKYALDANVFIDAARRYYAFDLAPGFWSGLVAHARTGEIRSIDRVRQELDQGKDDLAAWVDRYVGGAFASTDDEKIVQVYSDIMNWIQQQGQFTAEAKAEGANSADCWLVAYAKVEGCVVVTHEAPSPLARRTVKIPDLCRQFAVPYTSLFEMLRNLRICFPDYAEGKGSCG